jgi:prevent-host-death family protein
MITVGIRELKQRTSDIIRQVRKEGKEIQVTYRGDVVALILPVRRPPAHQQSTAWATLDTIAAEISAHWPEGVTGLDALNEVRG